MRASYFVLIAASVVVCPPALMFAAEPALQQLQAGQSFPPQGPMVLMIQATRASPEARCDLTVQLTMGAAILRGDTVQPRVRCQITSAVDDTGASLRRDPPAPKPSGVIIGVGLSKSAFVYDPFFLSLRLPSRKAFTIKELSGVAEVFRADRDPEAIITVKNFVGQQRLEVSHPSLSASGAKVTIVSAGEFAVMRKRAERDKLKAANRDKARQRGNGLAQNVLDQMVAGLASAFSDSPDDAKYSVVVFRDDPNDRIVDIQFFNSSGDQISNGCDYGTIGGKAFTRYDFMEEAPKTTVMRITVATPKSVEAVPFSIKDVLLP